MPSWMVHLRVTDKLLHKLCYLSETEFVFGNVAPDSGIPNEDWSQFTPSGSVSHFKTVDADGFTDIHINEFVKSYYSKEQRAEYNLKQKSFFLGYLTHLLTDILWVHEVVKPSKIKFLTLYENNNGEWWNQIKNDWYDLDFLYLQRDENLRAYHIYKTTFDFPNKYIDIFSADAFHNRRDYIVNYYNERRDNIHRDYIYLTESDVDAFIDTAAEQIYSLLIDHYL